MTGAKSVFSELDSGIRGMVKFSDSSVVEIEGHDTILFVDGAKSVFSELDSGIRGMVKFSDSSVVEIEGHDTILFVDKGGKHHKLIDVYFILRLKANIVSLGQLVKAGCHISIKRGLLRIRDDRRRLLTQV